MGRTSQMSALSLTYAKMIYRVPHQGLFIVFMAVKQADTASAVQPGKDTLREHKQNIIK